MRVSHAGVRETAEEDRAAGREGRGRGGGKTATGKLTVEETLEGVIWGLGA